MLACYANQIIIQWMLDEKYEVVKVIDGIYNKIANFVISTN